MENLKQHVLSQLPQLINSMEVEAKKAATEDAALLKAAIWDNNFVVDEQHKIIVQCTLKYLRPTDSSHWRRVYANQMLEEFGKEQMSVVKLAFGTDVSKEIPLTKIMLQINLI